MSRRVLSNKNPRLLSGILVASKEGLCIVCYFSYNETNDELSQGYYDKTNKRVNDSVFSARNLTTIPTRSNVAQATPNYHDNCYHAHNNGEDIDD